MYQDRGKKNAERQNNSEYPPDIIDPVDFYFRHMRVCWKNSKKGKMIQRAIMDPEQPDSQSPTAVVDFSPDLMTPRGCEVRCRGPRNPQAAETTDVVSL